jgi:hypothetical protein
MHRFRLFLYAAVLAVAAALLGAAPASASPTDPSCSANPRSVIGTFYAVRSITYLHVGSEDTCYPRAKRTVIKYRVYFDVKDMTTLKEVKHLTSATRTVTVGVGVSPTNLETAESFSFSCVKGRKYALAASMWYDDGSGGILKGPIWTPGKVICTV